MASPEFPFLPRARPVARRYARLEARLRDVIDPWARVACPACGRSCCRVAYCRATLDNPWYAFVRGEAGGAPLPADAAERKDPFGLGPRGCAVRAGRYVYCYSYNCPRLLGVVPAGSRRRAFRDASDLLRVVNRLPGGRLLHELRDPADLSPRDLSAIDAACGRALERLARLAETVGSPNRTPQETASQAREEDPRCPGSRACPPACTTARNTTD